MTGALLDIQNLTIELRQGHRVQPLVSDITFAVGQNRVLGLIGESGSGKSMISRAIMGLLPANIHIHSGHIYYLGRDLMETTGRKKQEHRGKRIGLILQNPMSAFNPVLTIGEQLTEGVRWHRHLSKQEAAELARDFLGRVGLAGSAARVMDSYPHMLSGGMLQRVMIAMVLMPEPQLVIADEPTTALDVTTQYRILELLAKLKEELGLTILFISHDLHVVSNICDDVVVLRRGQVVEQGALGSVFASPKHPYTQQLLRASTFDVGLGEGDEDVQFG